MSTRSNIAMQIGDDLYRTIYCHQDGYPSYNGAMLLDIYNTPEKVTEILNLGDLSFLERSLYPDPSKPHSFEFGERQDGVTVAYGRDRGEKNIEARELTLEQLKNQSSCNDYCYIFTKDNEWKFFKPSGDDFNLQDVKEVLDKEYKSYGLKERPVGYYGFLSKDIVEDFIKPEYFPDEVQTKENAEQVNSSAQQM